jgi:hypothetical protein
MAYIFMLVFSLLVPFLTSILWYPRADTCYSLQKMTPLMVCVKYLVKSELSTLPVPDCYVHDRRLFKHCFSVHFYSFKMNHSIVTDSSIMSIANLLYQKRLCDYVISLVLLFSQYHCYHCYGFTSLLACLGNFLHVILKSYSKHL